MLSCRLLAHLHLVAGGEVLWVFCCCAATTHLLSSLTHVYPDDHLLEKLDHIGIVALIVGTPLTQMMVRGTWRHIRFSCKQLDLIPVEQHQRLQSVLQYPAAAHVIRRRAGVLHGTQDHI